MVHAMEQGESFNSSANVLEYLELVFKFIPRLANMQLSIHLQAFIPVLLHRIF